MPQYVRVYNIGRRFSEELTDEKLSERVAHDREFRPGCAVFVDGRCVQTGYLGEQRCDQISGELVPSPEVQRAAVAAAAASQAYAEGLEDLVEALEKDPRGSRPSEDSIRRLEKASRMAQIHLEVVLERHGKAVNAARET